MDKKRPGELGSERYNLSGMPREELAKVVDNRFHGALKAREQRLGPPKWLDSVNYLSPDLPVDLQGRIKARLLIAAHKCHKSPQLIASSDCMRQAFNETAQTVFDAGFLTQELIPKISLLVWEAAREGNWFFLSQENRTEFAKQVCHEDAWSDQDALFWEQIVSWRYRVFAPDLAASEFQEGDERRGRKEAPPQSIEVEPNTVLQSTAPEEIQIPAPDTAERKATYAAYANACKLAGVKMTESRLSNLANANWTSRWPVAKWKACKDRPGDDALIRAVIKNGPPGVSKG